MNKITYTTFIDEPRLILEKYMQTKFGLGANMASNLASVLHTYIRSSDILTDPEREAKMIGYLVPIIKDGLVLVEFMEFVRWLDNCYWNLAFSHDTSWWKHLDDWDKK